VVKITASKVQIDAQQKDFHVRCANVRWGYDLGTVACVYKHFGISTGFYVTNAVRVKGSGSG
jgi:hypothetical protein